LAIQYWEIYVLINEKAATVADLWDGENPKCTFTRYVDNRLLNLWCEVVQLASTIVFSEEEASLIWQFNSTAVCSSQSLYKVINFRGVIPFYVPAVWNLKIPPRVHFFPVAFF
jgi:hypothetical protein